MKKKIINYNNMYCIRKKLRKTKIDFKRSVCQSICDKQYYIFIKQTLIKLNGLFCTIYMINTGTSKLISNIIEFRLKTNVKDLILL